jgi:membrane protein DedA with SNARE-associated domain
MSGIDQSIIDFLSAGQSAAGLAVLFVSAAVEYVFPPFPGDTITLFGAFLAATKGWSVPLVFTVVTLGSLVGATLDYALGCRLARIPENRLSGRKRELMKRAQSIVDRFERHGAGYIAVNRFLPGIRALFFVAAGMAGLPVGKVLLWGAVSAAAWNALIIGAGFAVGKNWERLLELLRTYTLVAWVVVGVVVAALIIRWWLKKNHRTG